MNNRLAKALLSAVEKHNTHEFVELDHELIIARHALYSKTGEENIQMSEK